MKVIDHEVINSLIFAFSKETLDMAIIDYIKIKEFTKHQKTIEKGHQLILYSLNYKVHKHRENFIIAYEYTTDPTESVYDPPVTDIAIKVPHYTSTSVFYRTTEEVIHPPPDNERRLIIKPKRSKKSPTDKNIESVKNFNNQAVYTAYCER